MSVRVNLYSIIVTEACCSDLRPPRSHTYLLSTPSEGKSELDLSRALEPSLLHAVTSIKKTPIFKLVLSTDGNCKCVP